MQDKTVACKEQETCWSLNQASESGRKAFWTWHGCWRSLCITNCWSTGIFTQTISGVHKQMVWRRKARGERRMATLCGAEMKATLDTTKLCRRVLWTPCSRCATTAEAHTGYHALLWAQNRKLKLQFAQPHQNWTPEVDSSNIHSLRSEFCVP